ncbi:MAG: diacylglycerol/lipid kinase family protein, partial [Candidatus Fimenecus sp.]
AKQAYFKKLPGVGGEFAYTMSLFYCLFRRLKSEFKIVVDDKETYEGTMLFSLCANGRWYGGGYKGAPKAVPNDGLLDFIMVRKTVGRLKLVGLVGKYKRGEHLSWDFTTFVRGKKMQIFSKKPAAVNVDGECEYVTESTFQVLEGALQVIMPDKAAYLKTVSDGEGEKEPALLK